MPRGASTPRRLLWRGGVVCWMLPSTRRIMIFDSSSGEREGGGTASLQPLDVPGN